MKTATRHHGVHDGARNEGDHSVTDELRDGVSQLRTDVADLVETAAGVGQAGARAVRDTAADAMDGVGRQISAIKDSAVESAASVGKQLGSRPFTTAMIAFGAGYLFARLSKRK